MRCRWPEIQRGPAQVQGLGHRYDSVALWTWCRGSVRQQRTLHDGYFSNGQQLAKGARILHAQLPINEGDSGGPLLNDRGEVVGVAAAVAWEHQGAGLFIDVAEVKALLGRAGWTGPGSRDAGGQVADGRGRLVYGDAVRILVLVQANQSERRHSGWVFDRTRRLIVTTAEAVGTRDTVQVTFPEFVKGQVVGPAGHYRDKKAQVPAVVLVRDGRRNLALLEAVRMPEDTQAARLAGEVPLPGDGLHALGNPDKLETLWLYSGGWMRQSGRTSLGQAADEPEAAVLLVQLAPAEGEDGGPVCNDRGELVGMLSGKSAAQQQIAYVLPVSEIQAFLGEQEARWRPLKAGDLVARGQLFLHARQPDRALVDFSAALEVDPEHAMACCERSRAFQDKGNLDRALEDSNRAIRLQPRLGPAYSQRAAVQVQRGMRAPGAPRSSGWPAATVTGPWSSIATTPWPCACAARLRSCWATPTAPSRT